MTPLRDYSFLSSVGMGREVGECSSLFIWVEKGDTSLFIIVLVNITISRTINNFVPQMIDYSIAEQNIITTKMDHDDTHATN